MVSCVQSSGPLRPWRCFWKWDYQGQDLWSQEYKKYVLHYCHAECGRINGGMSFLWIFKHTQIAISESVMEQMMISVIILLTMLNVGEMRSCVFLHAVCMHLHFVEVDASCVYIYKYMHTPYCWRWICKQYNLSILLKLKKGAMWRTFKSTSVYCLVAVYLYECIYHIWMNTVHWVQATVPLDTRRNRIGRFQDPLFAGDVEWVWLSEVECAI